MKKMAAREQRDMTTSSEDESSPVSGDLRRGPWTVEEDLLLVNYIAAHGEGRWNALARCAGLKRTGKSCRLRWLNYLRPDLRRGNMSAQEQLLILELHSRWGNRWSKIAQHLPGRTDNEIKNYWRTRVQKHARQLGCDVGSQQFRDLMRYLWMPRLLERVSSQSHTNNGNSSSSSSSSSDDDQLITLPPLAGVQQQQPLLVSPAPTMTTMVWSSTLSSSSMSMRSDDTTSSWCCQQPPKITDTTAPAGELLLETACWPSDLPAGSSLFYGDDMVGLPDLLETETTMWGSSDDDLWYTQIMGL